MKRESRKNLVKKYRIPMGGILLVLLLVGIAIPTYRKNANKDTHTDKQAATEKKTLEQLSADDQTIAETYAALYGESAELVAEMRLEEEDWDKVYERLEEAYFSIGETKKYQMAEDGYSLDDLEEAEILARQTGKKALDLALAKGKASDNKKWSDILDTDTAESVEEKLGLTGEQIEELKKKEYSGEDRIAIALLCFNRNESFEDVMKELNSGRSIAQLKEEIDDEK